MTLTLPTPASPLKIGTRGSPLALAQAHETRQRLCDAFDLPEQAFEIVVIKTTGDNRAMIDADRPLKEIGNKGLFTKEIEEAMLGGDIDIAVHSTKDMPVEQPQGLVLDTFLPREDVRDAFISPRLNSIHDLPEGAVVGTSSLRRRAQLLHRRPDLNVVEFRGNVQTRLKKLADGVAECTFLAMAGIRRLNMQDVPATAISPDDMLPAIAQGTIGIERRADDHRAAEMLEAIHHSETACRLAAERTLLAALDGSCETPIAGLAELADGQLRLRGEVLRPDGSDAISESETGSTEDAAEMGRAMAAELLHRAGPGFFEWRNL
ncbi:hydroxymethylbilane synthase [Ruegeria arenilitoris]|uniref:hydroxymethylbilane synthase n=1 Tax=Ruegeria arenilitoris TaxID=1173585 RepID=UPI001C988004|nr:hydroxymethylbilane synthase [Ruegeria arenilitoris]MBY6083610.1 hydroxymethylbilane synthase [Ruegeria arenilitoris]